MSETAVEPAGSNLPVTAGELGLDTGLEDFGAEDMVMPRLSIDHPNAVFVDNLTNESHEKLTVVILGLVKQRILWDEEVNEGDRPLCKSYDFREGVPGDNFPIKASGFDALPTDGGTLPCDACSLKDWGSNPRNDTPWCSEQHTFPLLMQAGGDPDNYGAPAILTVQRSAIKASKSYLTGFARSKTPVYTVVTELSLDARKKGSVNYAVPRFSKIGETDQDDWQEYARSYRSIREFLTTPRVEEPSDAASDAPRASSSGASEAASAVADDDDLPF